MADDGLTTPPKNTLGNEIENLAEGIEGRHFHAVSMAMTKILDALVPASSSTVSASDEATSTSGLAEIHKTIKALDNGDYKLAGICMRKAVAAYTGGAAFGVSYVSEPAVLKSNLEELTKYVADGEFTTAAALVRRIGANVQMPDVLVRSMNEIVAMPSSAPLAAPGVSNLPAVVEEIPQTAPVVPAASDPNDALRSRVLNLETRFQAVSLELQAILAEFGDLRKNF
jgi:hypothetical protein